MIRDVTKEVGAPASITGKDGKSRYPLASEWADTSKKGKSAIKGWRVLGPDEKPQRGDVVAYKLPGHGTSYSGHSGIVTSVGTDGAVHAMAAHDAVVGPDSKFQSTDSSVIYRRFTGDQ